MLVEVTETASRTQGRGVHGGPATYWRSGRIPNVRYSFSELFASQLLATERVSHRGGCSERQTWAYASSGRALLVELRLARRRGQGAGPGTTSHPSAEVFTQYIAGLWE